MNNNPGLNVAQLSSNIRKRRRELQLKQQDLANLTYPLIYIKAAESGKQLLDDPFLKYISNRLMVTFTDLEAGTWPRVPRKSLKERQASQLMDAHLALESRQFQKAKNFLAKLQPAKIHSSLQPNYYAILGETEVELGNYEAARPVLLHALELYKSWPDTNPLQVAQVRNCLGVSYARQRSFAEAVEHWKLCLNAISDGLINEDRFRMKIYLNLSSSYTQLGEIKQAIVYYREAATIAEKNQEETNLAAICWGLGVCYRTESNYPQAKIILLKGIKLYNKLGDFKSVVDLNNLLGVVLIDNGEYAEAANYLFEAMDIVLPVKDEPRIGLINLNLAYLYFSLQEWDAAPHYAKLAIEQNRQSGDKLNLGLSLNQFARIKAEVGEIEVAIELFEEAIKVLEITDSKEATKKTYLRYAEALERVGRMQEAAVFYRKANNLVVV